MQLIDFTEVGLNSTLTAAGLAQPARVRDAQAFELGISRRPDSASFVTAVTRKKWLFLGERSCAVAIRQAEHHDTDWILSEVDRRVPPPHTLSDYALTLHGPTYELARGLAERGFALDFLITAGTLDNAISRIPTSTGSPSIRVDVREAIETDVPSIIGISQALGHEQGHKLPREVHLPHERNFLQEFLNGTRLTTVLEADGKVVGFMSAGLVEVPSQKLLSVGLEILIAPALRGQGLARRLYHRTMDRLTHLKRPILLSGIVAHPATQKISAETGRKPCLVLACRGASSTESVLKALQTHELAYSM